VGIVVRPADNLTEYFYHEPTTYNSFSGVDIQAAVYVPDTDAHDPLRPKDITLGNLKVFGELQTLTVSSFRGVAPVRRLGESWPRTYAKGSRTLAGSMVFSVLERDVWSHLYKMDRSERRTSSPFFVDQLPPFNITITAANEQGHVCTQAILGVTITNFGTTYSVEDLLVESTYSYVAEAITPFAKVKISDILKGFMNSERRGGPYPASSLIQVKNTAPIYVIAAGEKVLKGTSSTYVSRVKRVT